MNPKYLKDMFTFPQYVLFPRMLMSKLQTTQITNGLEKDYFQNYYKLSRNKNPHTFIYIT